MNKPWDGVRNPTAEEAAQDKFVKRLIPPRVKQLEYIAEHFLSRIIETVDQVPFGIRWICRQLAEMAQKRFPDADRYQIGGLVGGYIYLRFFNPVIVTPESVHFVEKKLSKVMRRNLILNDLLPSLLAHIAYLFNFRRKGKKIPIRDIIYCLREEKKKHKRLNEFEVAKILQILSNGVEFRDQYMQALSPWVEKHREDIQTYFARLIDVDQLSDRMDVDNLLEHTKKRDEAIQISFNQIFLVHRLLLKHRKDWNPTNNLDDPVLKILVPLGSAPEPVKHADNHTINIRLAVVDDKDFKEQDKANLVKDFFANFGTKDPTIKQVREKIKSILLNESVPEIFMDQFRSSLRAYLQQVKEWAKNHGKYQIMQDCDKAIQGIAKNIQSQNGSSNDTSAFNNFLLVYVNEVRDMKRRVDRFHQKVEAVEKARDTITDHANYLGSKLEAYQQYLNNIMENDKRGVSGSQKEKKTKKKAVKFTHQKLLALNVIVDVDEEVIKRTRANFNNLIYYFSRGENPDEFQVEVKYKVGFGAKISPFPEPFQLSFSKLLEMKDDHSTRYQLEMVTLNVERLIDLNEHEKKQNKNNKIKESKWPHTIYIHQIRHILLWQFVFVFFACFSIFSLFFYCSKFKNWDWKE
ncbi:RasGTPase-activating protein [Reticulomyxa filosa]|uniref:RasGTPase-activating protein n=1 Tax=Reticulomyxa filosa TaxID=46433 RepID=X6NQR8_RETFI|nr:RasGTPase-activating protein [Reticulomyxa filosa]|eukprot:ETO28351.1 RasGTPase-activating protein [Reticulomyxa filosa]